MVGLVAEVRSVPISLLRVANEEFRPMSGQGVFSEVPVIAFAS
jgi:hypothetical protein